ncbi:MAG: extracellular solute-binding protein [Gammaproteobacteria bacterium]|nr:extracellular solute-binding protein [Gammaproteobacteria bacterium]MDH3480427.1 extracellular solute-binding protein [Gammaproteobacteria bacterium]
MKRLAVTAALSMLAMAGCDSAPRPEAVVVYATAADETTLVNWFAEFTDETGVPVTVIFGDSSGNTQNVIGNRGAPPADVLLTSTVIDIWRAADEGGLRPIQAAALEAVPPVLKDPDGLWAALDVRYAVIGVSPHVQVGRVSDLNGLANAQLGGQLCLSSSALPLNRTLIAMLIEDLGVKPAERMMRAWVRNLALPPFPTEAELVAALRSGACGYGVFSSSIKTDGIKRISPAPLYIDIDGVGIARHARHPEPAHMLVDWMLARKALREPVSSNGRNIGLAGWRAEDARLLAERAAYR